MMRIDFYYDFISPYSYLAAMQLPKLERAYDLRFCWLPVNLPKLIKLSGNTPPGSIPNKARYLARDLKRKAKVLQLPLKLYRPGAFDSRPVLYLACALDEAQRARFSLSVFEALWSGDVDPRKDGWLERLLSARDLPEAWLSMAGESERRQLQENTDMALQAGAFGAPSFVVHQGGRRELFFGVDHLPDMLRACAAAP